MNTFSELIQFKDNNTNQINDDYMKLIKRLSNLLPIECNDKLKALEEIMSYVASMLYGDDLHQFCTYNYYKKYVTTALDELVVYVQEHSIKQYKQELELLRKEINNYLYEKEQYLKEIEVLKKEKESLQSKVDSLRKENKLLINENTNVKTSIDKHSAMMKKLVSNNQVIWEKVKEDDTIYAITRNKIANYISELEKAYMCKLGVSQQECESDFMLNSTGLYELKSLLLSFRDEDNYNKPISQCIKEYKFLGIDCSRGVALGAMMKNVKLPKIIERAPALTTLNLTNDTGDLNGLLKDLYYQKIAFEALAKQKIAEAQLYSLIMSLKQIMPENYDFNQLTEALEANQIKQLLEDNGQSFTKKR